MADTQAMSRDLLWPLLEVQTENKNDCKNKKKNKIPKKQ
jgi:hypothetical protein